MYYKQWSVSLPILPLRHWSSSEQQLGEVNTILICIDIYDPITISPNEW